MKLGMDTALLRAIYDSVVTRTVPITAHESHFDVTTQTQGLFWCPDLTAADPTGILQGSLLLVTVTNLLASPARTYTSTWRQWLLNTNRQQWTYALCMSVIYGLLWHMPAGLYLYWLSSAVIGRLQQTWLNYSRPIDPVIEKCKIPVTFGISDIRSRRDNNGN